MISRLHIPLFPLNQFIESFFYYSGFQAEHALDRFLPDGNVYMVFDLTDDPKYIYDNISLQEVQTCRRVWFSGFRTVPITIPSGRESEMLVVNFLKGKALPFLCEPLFALTNQVVDAEMVLNKTILDLREQMQEAENVRHKFQVLENGLCALCSSSLNPNPCVDFVIDKIIAAPNQVSLKLITQKVGYSQKHLIKIFKDHTGVTPKDFLQVIRFQKAIAEIEDSRQIQWTRVAHDCGFYDQSHFIANFKNFSGWTPEEYLIKKQGLPNYVPIKD